MAAIFESLEGRPKTTFAIVMALILIAGYIGAPPEMAGF